MAEEKNEQNAGETGPQGETGPAAGETGAAQTGAEATGATGPAAETGAPEKYEIKLPDGSLLDASAIERTASFAKEQGLSNKAAQALLDRESKLLGSYAEGQQKVMKETVAGWLETSKGDKEFGGEKFGERAELAKRVIHRFGNKELIDGLNNTGFGNHPELIRMFVKIGQSMSEDQLILPGAKPAGQGKEMADVFYGPPKTE